MEKAGVLQGRVAILDPIKLNVGVTVFVAIKTAQHSQEWLERFARHVDLIEEVVEFYRMSGDIDYLLRVVVPDIAAYDAFYQKLIAKIEIRDVAADERGVYALHPNAPPARVQAFSRLTSRFVSLAPSGAAFLAPTALVAGFSMHRFGVGVDPMEDTRKKIGAIAPVRPNAKILDVCTGLAYTACAASALGARVTTIELDPAMTEMCRANPRSRALFTGEIRQLYGDAAEVVKTLPDESFDRIVHDPPTFALAGQLFGGEFYAELLRVLKTKGTMYHYVGDPASRSAGNVARGAVGRLKRAGFADAVIDYDAHGIVAVKTGRVRLKKSNERGRRRRDGSEEDDGRAGSGGGRGVGKKGRAKGRAAARGGGDGARRDGARRGRGRRGDARGDPRRGRDEGNDATLKNEFF